MLQWIDPETGQRKSKSAKTADAEDAETARADLEYELSHGKYQEASKLDWDRFRELFETEYAATLRTSSQEKLASTPCLPSVRRSDESQECGESNPPRLLQRCGHWQRRELGQGRHR
jgi:hypothetical protein